MYLFYLLNLIPSVSKELVKKAVDMLLKGATLVSEPCPYCNGVRIMQDGNALCVNCGRETDKEKIVPEVKMTNEEKKEPSPIDKLDEKLKELTNDLEKEKDHEKQQQILKSINEIIAIKEKLKNL